MNGELVEPADAVVSVFDHGLVTGDGVFESVVVHGGRPFALSRHLARLQRSAATLGLDCPPLDELRAAAVGLAEEAGFEEAKLRITVTGGPGPLGSPRGGSKATVIVACEEISARTDTATVVTVPWPRSELSATAGAKTISYAENVVALAYATERGASEALFLNLAGNLCEGTGSNVFVAVGGRLVTPPLSAGCLAGVTRGLIIEVTGAVEQDVSRLQLAEITEAFLSSTTRGVQPVSVIDGRQLVAPGPLTEAAAVAFAALVERGVS